MDFETEEAFRLVREEAKRNPGKRFRDPRFPGNEPAFEPPDLTLKDYLAQALAGWEFFGPRIGRDPGTRPGDNRENELFVAADLTGNGVVDYGAVIRRSQSPRVVKVVAFLQRSDQGNYEHAELRFPASAAVTRVRVIEVGYIRRRQGLKDVAFPNSWIHDRTINDEEAALLVTNYYSRCATAYYFRGAEIQQHDVSC